MTDAHVKLVALHIGAHKTGTSVVQDYLRRTSDEFARHRVEVLKRRDMGDFIKWGRALRDTPERLVARVDRFISSPDADMLLGSNENTIGRPFTSAGEGRLYPDGPANIRALARSIRGCRARIVLSVRPQADFLESYYLQTVHEGGSASFRTWLDRVDLDELSWRPMVTELHDWFGPENVTILDFRAIRHGQDAYLSRFVQAIGAGFEPQALEVPSRNRSVSEKGLQLALIANREPRSGTQRGALRKFFQQNFSNVDYPRAILLSVDERQAIEQRYAAEYDELTAAGAQSTPEPELAGRIHQ